MKRLWKKGFLWVTGSLFLISISGQWVAGWFEFVNEQKEHNQAPRFGEYSVQMLRGTFENWQSEFLQLIWQVCGLSFLYYVGSPQSREGEERTEAKLDEILLKLDPENGKSIIAGLNKQYPKE
jgi:hypothetical protein